MVKSYLIGFLKMFKIDLKFKSRYLSTMTELYCNDCGNRWIKEPRTMTCPWCRVCSICLKSIDPLKDTKCCKYYRCEKCHSIHVGDWKKYNTKHT